MTQILNTNTFCQATWIVSPTSSNGTHTTIQSAINSASSGDTIFVRDGTYTEDLTLKAGVLITCDRGSPANPNVTVIGNATFTGTGTATLANLRLQTNSGFLVTVSGANVSALRLLSCSLQCTNHTGISYTNSNASSSIFLSLCGGDTALGYALYSSSSAGTLEIRYSNFTNSGASTTQNTNSAGTVNIHYCQFFNPFSTSSSGVLNSNFSYLDTSAQNVTAVTTAGTGQSAFRYNDVYSGSASAISVGAGTTVSLYEAVISSSNTNAITGAGTLNYGGVIFVGSSKTINTTTTVPVNYSVPEGGTGVSSFTAYTVLCAGTTTTSALQNVASVGTTGQVLTSNGASALPTFQNITPLTLTVNNLCNFRLTLTSGSPITGDVSAATTIYWTPFRGNFISLYDTGSSTWENFTSAELNFSVPATTNSVYDVFAYNNSGTVALTTLIWASTSARATGLSLQNGVYVLSSDASRRYVGSFATSSSSGKTNDSVTSRLLYNYYNRTLRTGRAVDATNTWTYSLATFRQANANTANQLVFLTGLAEDAIQVDVRVCSSTTTAESNAIVGIGLNSTTVNSATCWGSGGSSVAATAITALHANYLSIPTLGLNNYVWLEASNAGGNTTTWYGSNGFGSITNNPNGIVGSYMM